MTTVEHTCGHWPGDPDPVPESELRPAAPTGTAAGVDDQRHPITPALDYSSTSRHRHGHPAKCRALTMAAIGPQPTETSAWRVPERASTALARCGGVRHHDETRGEQEASSGLFPRRRNPD